MTQHEQHRIELLEAEIRRLRQALRTLADAVIAGHSESAYPLRQPYSPRSLALAAKNMLGEGDDSPADE